MKKTISARLDAIEKQRARNKEAAELEAFNYIGPLVALAYYIGDLKPNEPLFEGFARALEYRNLNGLCRALTRVLKTGNASDMRKRHDSANRQLFARFQCSRSSQEALEESIASMVERLPRQWKAWIGSFVLEADPYKERQLQARVKRIWSKLEKMAMAEAEARK